MPHFLSSLSTIWKAWLTTEMACRLACVQEQPVFLIKTFFWVPGKGKHICVHIYITYSVEHMETCGATTVKMWSYVIRDFLSQVGLSDENFGDFLAGSVKNARHQWVFIVPQSGSLCQVTEGKKTNSHELLAASRNSRAVKRFLTSRLVDHIKNKLLRFILHLQRQQTKMTSSVNLKPGRDTRWSQGAGLFTLNLCSSRLRTCPVVIELLTRTLVTEPYAGVNTDVWREERKKHKHICSWEDKTYWNTLTPASLILVIPGTLWMFWKGRSKEILPAGTC